MILKARHDLRVKFPGPWSQLSAIRLSALVMCGFLLVSGCASTTHYPSDYPSGWPVVATYGDIETRIQGKYKCFWKARDSGTEVPYIGFSKYSFAEFVISSKKRPDCYIVTIRREENDNLVITMLGSDQQQVERQVLRKGREYVVKDGWIWLKDPPDDWHRGIMARKMKTYLSLTEDGHLVAKYHASSTDAALWYVFYGKGVDYGLFQRVQ